jgi:hypothetical protein
MCFVTKVFYGEELLAPRPTPKLEDHPVSAVRDCLFNIFAATLLIGGRSSIRNPRTRHAVVTTFVNFIYNSVSQPPGHSPITGPGINYTGPREILLEFVILVF